MRPNLLSFATGELSQGAMLCWLLAWAHQDCEMTVPEPIEVRPGRYVECLYWKEIADGEGAVLAEAHVR